MRVSDEPKRSPLARIFPERTLLVRSDHSMRYVRLSSSAQAAGAAAVTLALLWTTAATALLAIESYERSARDEAILMMAQAYERRLGNLEADLAEALAASEAAEARNAAAAAEITERHDALAAAMAAEQGLREALGAQRTRLAALEAEAAAAAAARAAAETESAELAKALAESQSEQAELADTLERVAAALDATAAARDDAEAAQELVEGALGALEADAEEQREAQARLLAQIEAAAQLSIGPLEEALGAAGVDVDDVVDKLRRSGGGEGGPFVPAPEIIAALGPTDEAHVASVMSDLERVTLLRAAVRQMPFATPVAQPRITSGFGRRRDPFNRRSAMHEGVDFSGAHGTAIYSTAHGVVTFAGVQRGYGRVVKIRHDFGFETVYGHLSRARVSVGDRVEPGSRIGDMGSTGRSTGTHLHYEIRVNGTPVNPMKFIEAARDVL